VAVDHAEVVEHQVEGRHHEQHQRLGAGLDIRSAVQVYVDRASASATGACSSRWPGCLHTRPEPAGPVPAHGKAGHPQTMIRGRGVRTSLAGRFALLSFLLVFLGVVLALSLEHRLGDPVLAAVLTLLAMLPVTLYLTHRVFAPLLGMFRAPPGYGRVAGVRGPSGVGRFDPAQLAGAAQPAAQCP